MAKQLVFGDEARRYLKSGVDAVANASKTAAADVKNAFKKGKS